MRPARTRQSASILDKIGVRRRSGHEYCSPCADRARGRNHLLGGGASQAAEERAAFHDVEGLAYSGASGSSGTTGKHGEFHFAAGDQVTFAIGELVLGTADMGAGGACSA